LQQASNDKPTGDFVTGELNFGPYKIESHGKAVLEGYVLAPDMNQFLGRLAACIGDSDAEFGIIDVGANCGDTAALMRSYAKLPILCIEGDPELYALLQKNSGQLPDTTLANVYVGETTGSVSVKIEKQGWNNTLVPSETASSVVQIVRLDELTHPWFNKKKIGLLKVDTEGFDVPILFGAKKLLELFKPVIAFEYNRDNMDAIAEPGIRVFPYLESLGYEGLVIYDNYGRCCMTSKVQNFELLKELHHFIEKPKRGIFYFDMVVFPKGKEVMFKKFRDAEIANI
jgi:FkbM family methyltransferase